MPEYKLLKLDDVHVVFIMFGDACNLQCKYCMQHEIIENPTAVHTCTINKDIYSFIKSIAENSEHLVDVRFYGGEPLLFFDQIKEVVKTIRDMDLKVMFSIITNGKLLSQESVDYFNKEGVSVAISWDGAEVEKTRGYDAIKSKYDLIMQLDHLCIDGVMTPYSYLDDFIKAAYEFVKEYNKGKDSVAYINYDTLMKFRTTDKEIGDVDLDEISKQSYAVANTISAVIAESRNPTELERYYSDIFYNIVNSIAMFDPEGDHSLTKCGNGVKVINMNLKGDLYMCHNTNRSFSNIYEDHDTYMDKLRSEDPTSKNIESGRCKSCEIFSVCRGGCPLVTDEDRSMDKSYCDIQKAFYTPFIKVAKMYKSV